MLQVDIKEERKELRSYKKWQFIGATAGIILSVIWALILLTPPMVGFGYLLFLLFLTGLSILEAAILIVSYHNTKERLERLQ